MDLHLHRPAAVRCHRRPAHLRRPHHPDRHRLLPAAHHQDPPHHPPNLTTPSPPPRPPAPPAPPPPQPPPPPAPPRPAPDATPPRPAMIDALGSLINQLPWAMRDAVLHIDPPPSNASGPVQF